MYGYDTELIETNKNLPKLSSSLEFLGLFHYPYCYAILENAKLENETCYSFQSIFPCVLSIVWVLHLCNSIMIPILTSLNFSRGKIWK